VNRCLGLKERFRRPGPVELSSRFFRSANQSIGFFQFLARDVVVTFTEGSSDDFCDGGREDMWIQILFIFALQSDRPPKKRIPIKNRNTLCFVIGEGIHSDFAP